MDNKELEAIVGEVVRKTKAQHVVMLVVTDGAVEIIAATRPEDSHAESRLNLAYVLSKVAEEIKDGGGMAIGNDGEIVYQ